MLTNTDVILT